MKNKKSFQKTSEIISNPLPDNAREGLIVTHFGAVAEVEDTAGNIFRCHLRKNQDPVMTGDEVWWQLEQEGTGTIIQHKPRRSLLARPEKSGKIKPIAANIDIMIIVMASLPVFSEYLIDRYLIAAEYLKIQPLILLNKKDLLDQPALEEMQSRLAVYEKMGYPVIFSSIYLENGLTELVKHLPNKTCILVGTSGVGKSSIIKTLVTDAVITTSEVSATTSLGKHTTTGTRLYHLPQGACLIDSPGVREFGLWNMSPAEVLQGFIEFQPFLGNCKFRDCRHSKEPECALLQAVQDKKISVERLRSYWEIVGALPKIKN